MKLKESEKLAIMVTLAGIVGVLIIAVVFYYLISAL